MTMMNAGNARLTVRALLCVMSFPVLFALLTGCGGKVDDKFAAESYDEYTQPLTNAVIGTPTGTIVVGAPIVTDSGTAGGGMGSSGGPIAGGSSSGGGGSSSGGGVRDGGVGGGDGGIAPDGGTGSGGGFGFWHFDDCSATSNFLVDSSGAGANAQHALGGACVQGVSGLGVQIRNAKDVVQVPDEPQFTVSSRIGIAAWVHPDTVSGNQPIVIKRLNNQTAFSLGIHNGNIEMAVVLTSGTTVISRAPIAAGTWTHVAGMYDGTFVFLFINGQQFGQVFAGGTLRNVFAPLRIGATTQTQHFNGIIDEVFVTSEAISSFTLTSLACIHHPSTLAVSPATSGPVPFDTTVQYDVAVTNNDFGFCGSKFYEFFTNSNDTGISVVPNFAFQSATPGMTVNFTEAVTGSDSADPGVHQIPFSVQSFGQSFEFLSGQLTYELQVPTGCFVISKRELMITSTSVVDDPVRTFGSDSGGFGFFDGGSGGGSSGGSSSGGSGGGIDAAVVATDAGSNPSMGVWTLGHLLREMAPTPEQAPAFALQLFQHWLTDQTVNGFTVAARPAIQQVLLDNWPKTATGDLDLDRAPLRLQAIVARLDVRDLSVGSAGEGRFVFAVNGPFGPQSFTVILEYNLPGTTQQDVVDWANRWHALSTHPFPSEEYNAALEALTRRFTSRNAFPSGVNGSALFSLRTNEIALSFQWELRLFELSSATGFLEERALKETPDLSFNGTQTFSDLVNQNAAAIIALVPGGTGNTVPPQFEGQNFQAGSIFNNQVEWNGPGITDPEARFHASMNTCNGCHGPETGTFNFTMITPRFPGSESVLSPFITGTTVFDRFSGQSRILNDLGRRRADLMNLVCPTDGGSPPPPDASPPPPPVDDAGPVPSVDAGLAGD